MGRKRSVKKKNRMTKEFNPKIKIITTNLLKPYKRNARIHSKKQIEAIAKSIQENGFIIPIVVDKENVIVAGHGRFEAAKLLNIKQVPVISVNHLTEEQIKKYRLIDNSLSSMSEWHLEFLSCELSTLDFDDEWLSEFSLDFIDEENVKPKETKTIPPKKNHALISFDNNLLMDVCSFIDRMEEIDGIEIERNF
jgi:hypothetical protein